MSLIPQVIFSDFDGTLTLGEELSPCFFKVLDLIQELGSELVIVSGRSVSWGHFLLTHLPVRACVMEGGGVILRKKGELITEEILVSQPNIEELLSTTKELEKKYPGLLSIDSFGRKTDRAVELFLLSSEGQEKEIETFLEARGARHSTSNVHINFWYGNISKYNAMEIYLQSSHPELSMNDCLYFGDALNDQSVFRHMQHTVGVSNIASVLHKMDYRPEVILTGEENIEVKGVYNFLKSLK